MRNCGIKECTVVEKNVSIPERFFDNHYMIGMIDQMNICASSAHLCKSHIGMPIVCQAKKGGIPNYHRCRCRKVSIKCSREPFRSRRMLKDSSFWARPISSGPRIGDWVM